MCDKCSTNSISKVLDVTSIKKTSHPIPMKREYTYKALKVSPYNNSSHLTSVESKNVYKALDYKNIIKPNTREK